LTSRSDLTLVVSPYLVGPADPALHAAAALASRVVTYLPTPCEFAGGTHGHKRVRTAAHACPEYLRLLDAWSWTVPLWTQGVMRCAIEGDCPQRELPAAEAALRDDPRLKLAAHAIKPGLLERDAEYLPAVCTDILKGGADPGLTTLVAAALDRYCARRGYVGVRAGPGPRATPSVVQRGEHALSRRLFAVAIPVPVQASGAWVCTLRDGLKKELSHLRAAIVKALHAPDGADALLTKAASDYTGAFTNWRRAAGPPVTDDDLGKRVVDATVSITGATLPADAALRASAAAIRATGIAPRSSAPGVLPARGTPDDQISILTIRRMNIQPDAAPAPRGHARAAQ
jgi:hypothetical protein